MAQSVEKPESAISQGKTFLSESVDELKKVTYPTRAETIQATLITLVIMSFIAVCLFLMDLLFNTVMDNLLRS